MSDLQIGEDRTEKLRELCDEYNIELLVVFGSAARGELRDESDIDLAYDREEALSLRERAAFGESVRAILEEDRPVDLIWLTSADPLHLKKISEDARRLVGSDEQFQRFRRRAFHRYSDYKPFLEREKKETARRIKRLL